MRLIDAEKLPVTKGVFMPKIGGNIYCGQFQAVFKDDIDEAPTVDPVKHGHWDMYRTYYRCSNCLCQDAIGLAPYCKNCGSKMDNGVS